MKYRIDSDRIMYANLDESEGVLLDLKTKNYFRLNETGQRVWQELQKDLPEGEIAQKITDEFDAPYEIVLADVRRLLFELTNERLLEKLEKPNFSVEGAHHSKMTKASS